MEKIRELLKQLCFMPTVSGRELDSKNALFALVGDAFDEKYEDTFGNLVFVLKSKKENAPRLMIDAHLDTVGFMVTKVHKNGFLSITPIGGIDTRVLGATRAVVYGKEIVNGVFTSVPPHLSASSKALPKVEDVYVDCANGSEHVSIGDIVTYRPHFTELCANKVSAYGLDDKACICAMLDMAFNVDREKLAYDLYLVISAQEEVGKGGARFVAYDVKPDIAVVTDVFFAGGEGIERRESAVVGEGAYIDISSATNIRLTRKIIKDLEARGVKHQVVCEPSRTHTNNEIVSITGAGVRTMLCGIALDGMHTPSEIVSLEDIRSLSSLLINLAENGEI